jgi:3-phenylpropionate/cinnamic acid dioxygenase small subunit
MQLSEIEDRLKIHDLFARYMRSVDNWDEAELYACFTEDGVLESPIVGGRFVGRVGQRQFMINGRKMGEGRKTRHLFTNLEVELNGDRANARAYLVVNSTKDGKTTIFGTGHYECQLRKVDGRWLFSDRKVFVDGKP